MRRDISARSALRRGLIAVAALATCTFGNGLAIAQHQSPSRISAPAVQKQNAGDKRAIIFVGGKKQRSKGAGCRCARD